MASANTSGKKFRPPPISPGKWHIETDGLDDFVIMDEEGGEVAVLDRFSCPFGDVGTAQFESNLQCISLVPELVRGIYAAMHALMGNIPDNETEKSIAVQLQDLLKRVYSSPSVER